MAAPAIDTSKPVFGAGAVDDDLDQLRDNIIWLMTITSAVSYELPGWAATPSGSDLDAPDYIEVVENGATGVKMKFTFTYTGDNVTAVLYQFDKGLGAGYETMTTVTNSFNGSDQWTGNTST